MPYLNPDMPKPVRKKLREGYLLEVSCCAGVWRAGLLKNPEDALVAYGSWAKTYTAAMSKLAREIEKKMEKRDD